MKVVCCIPARAGSKSVPFKNIKDLCGQPLISYAILDALRTKQIGRSVYVSSDSGMILNIAE